MLIATLLVKIIPLYMNILLGFMAGKLLDTSRDSIAKIMFYLINPIIIFNGVVNVKLSASVLSLPFVTFGLSTFLSITVFKLAGYIWNDSSRNLAAFTAGTGNVGYFGLPLALLLFDNEGEGEYIISLLGVIFFESSIGYYLLAKDQHSIRECIRKLLKLPSIYAFSLALLLNFSHFKMPEIFVEFLDHIKGTYNVLGMMIIGLGLASMTHFKVDLKFIGLSFFVKFVIWPALTLTFIFVDTTFFGFYSTSVHKALILMSIVPIAVNTVILASILKTQPEKASTAVLFSTFFALFYIPLMATWLIQPAIAS